MWRFSQLSRQVENRSDNKRPQLSDLRESGAIEQDADIVCFIHRPEYYYHSDTDPSGKDIRGLAEFIIAKHRSGSVKDVNMRFRAQFARFENWIEEGGESIVESIPSRLNMPAGDGSAASSKLVGGSADFLSSSDEPTPF